MKRGTGEAVSDHMRGAQEVAESSRSRGSLYRSVLRLELSAVWLIPERVSAQ